MRRHRVRTPFGGRRSIGAAFAALVVAVSLSAAAGASHGSAPAHVIVLARPGSEARVEARARKLGATIERRLPIVDGFAARLPAASVPLLRLQQGVLSVTSDGPVHADSSSYDPGADPGWTRP